MTPLTSHKDHFGRTLLIAFLVLALIPLISASILTIWFQYTNSQEQLQQHLLSVATLKEAQTRTWFNSLSTSLTVLADQPGIRTIGTISAPSIANQEAQALAMMKRMLANTHSFKELFLLDIQGEVHLATDPMRMGQNYARQPFAYKGQTGPYIQPPFYSLAYDQIIVMVSVPVQNNASTVTHVLIGVVTLEQLNDIMSERSGLGTSGETYLVSTDYVMLTEPRNHTALVHDLPAVRTLATQRGISGKNGIAIYDNYYYPPESVIGVYRWIPELRVVLLAEMTQKEAFAAIYQQIWLSAGTLLITTLLTIVAAVLVTRSIAKPLIQLTNNADRIARGDLTTIVATRRSDEIGQLANAFHTMTLRLRGLISSLEARVAERTAELEAQKEALKQSEQRLALHMRLAPLAAIELNPYGEVIEWNLTSETLFGYSRTEVLGKPFVDLIVPAEQREHTSQALRDLLNRRGTSQMITTNCARSGHTLICEWHNTALVDHNNQVIGIALLGQDVTERKHVEEILLHRQKLESLGVLAGGIAHDFNNLLMVMLGNASLALLDIPQDSPAAESVRQIEQAVRRATDLTRQMLAYSGRGHFVVERFDLNGLIYQISGLLQVPIAQDVELLYCFSERPVYIDADLSQIRQIVMNLVMNAAEAIVEPGGTITIATELVRVDSAYLATTYLSPELPPGQYVMLSVTDTGIGIDSTTLSKVFEPFFTTKFTGRGLGLPTVLGIVRGHGGTLKTTSIPGEGTIFRVLLPSAEFPASFN